MLKNLYLASQVLYGQLGTSWEALPSGQASPSCSRFFVAARVRCGVSSIGHLVSAEAGHMSLDVMLALIFPATVLGIILFPWGVRYFVLAVLNSGVCAWVSWSISPFYQPRFVASEGNA